GAGHTLYAAGLFSTVGGRARHYAAAVDASTGSVLDWNPALPGWSTCIAAEPGRVYLGGLLRVECTGGPECMFYGYLKAIDATTGTEAAPDFRYGPYGGDVGVGTSLVVTGSTIAEGFGWNGPYSGEGVSAWDTNTGALLWSPDFGGTVSCLLSSGGTLYAGGMLMDFTDI